MFTLRVFGLAVQISAGLWTPRWSHSGWCTGTPVLKETWWASSSRMEMVSHTKSTHKLTAFNLKALLGGKNIIEAGSRGLYLKRQTKMLPAVLKEDERYKKRQYKVIKFKSDNPFNIEMKIFFKISKSSFTHRLQTFDRTCWPCRWSNSWRTYGKEKALILGTVGGAGCFFILDNHLV